MAIGTAAAIVGSAVIGAGASVAAGSKAAKAQKNAAALQAQNERYFYDTARSDQAPWREAGGRALSKLEQMYGLRPMEGGASSVYDAVRATPGYQFRFDEGQKAIERSAAARGLLRSGASLKALARFGDGLASDEYDAYTRRLSGIAGVGQAATNATQQAGAQAAQGISAAYRDAGAARASSYQNTGAAINQGVQNIASAYLWQRGSQAPRGGTWI